VDKDTQERNKVNTGIGQYRGVCWHKHKETWRGQVLVNGVTYATRTNKCEHQACRELNEIRKQHLGPNTPLNNVVSDCSTCKHCNPTLGDDYRGVSKSGRRWRGTVTVNGVTQDVPTHPCRHEVARRLNTLRLKVLGPTAKLNKIQSDCEDCPHCSTPYTSAS
jgi:hypothetical protein